MEFEVLIQNGSRQQFCSLHAASVLQHVLVLHVWILQSSTKIRSADSALCNYKHHLLDSMQFDFMAASVRYLKSTLPVRPGDF